MDQLAVAAALAAVRANPAFLPFAPDARLAAASVRQGLQALPVEQQAGALSALRETLGARDWSDGRRTHQEIPPDNPPPDQEACQEHPMTIATTTPKSRYAGDGGTTGFPTGFKFLDTVHVRVILQQADGSETLWTEGSEYSLSGAGAPGGGTVTVSTSPIDHTPQLGETLVVKLAIPPEQQTALPLGGAFPSTAVEGMADLAALRDQQLEEALSRAVKFKETTALADVAFPEPEAGKVARWNASADALESSDLPTFLDGTGAPAGSLGKVDDRYIDNATGDVYRKTGDTVWSLTGSFVGPQGDTGATGATGPEGPQGPAGNDGVFTEAASQLEAEAGVSNTKGMTPLRTAQAIAAVAGGALATFDTVATAQIDNNAINNSKLADMAAATLKGRAVGVDVGDPQDLTPAAARSLLNVADGATANPNTLDHVAEDTTPQLGGQLDGQGNAAVNVSYDVVAAKIANFTFALAEAGRLVPCDSGSAMNATVPPNSTTAFAVGTTLAIWNRGAGTVTWVAGSGVTLNRDAALTLDSNGQHAVSFAIKVATDTWIVAGGLAAA